MWIGELMSQTRYSTIIQVQVNRVKYLNGFESRHTNYNELRLNSSFEKFTRLVSNWKQILLQNGSVKNETIFVICWETEKPNRVKKNKLSNLCKKAKSRKIQLHENADVNRNSRFQSFLSSKPNNFQLLWNFERNLIAQKWDKLSRSKYLVVFLWV